MVLRIFVGLVFGGFGILERVCGGRNFVFYELFRVFYGGLGFKRVVWRVF